MKIVVTLNLVTSLFLLITGFMYLPGFANVAYIDIAESLDQLNFNNADFYLFGPLLENHIEQVISISFIVANISLVISVVYCTMLLNGIVLRKTIMLNCILFISLTLFIPYNYPSLWFITFTGYLSVFLEGMIFAVYVLQAKPAKDEQIYEL